MGASADFGRWARNPLACVLALAAIGAGATISLVLGSCGVAGLYGPGTGIDAGGAGGASPDAGADAEAGEAGAGPSSTACVPPAGLDHWTADTDSCWHRVAWPNPATCDVLIADQPRLAVPRLEWSTCPNFDPSCTKFHVNWKHSPYGIPIDSARAVSWSGGLRVGMVLSWSSPTGIDNAVARRAAIYDVDGWPLVAWRTELCGFHPVEVGPERVWLGVAGSVGDAIKEAYIGERYVDLAGGTTVLPFDTPAQATDATDDTYSMWFVGGGGVRLYDRLSGKVTDSKTLPLPGGTSYHTMHPIGDIAVGVCAPTPITLDACIWNRAKAKIEPLLQLTGEIIPDIRSDGQTIVWLQVPTPEPFDPFPAGQIWTSPMATSAATLAPTKRRPSPAGVALDAGFAREGYFAIPTDAQEVHIYRLSDMQHWSFAVPPELGLIREIFHVDPTQVLVHTTGTILRQDLTALGPGDPP